MLGFTYYTPTKVAFGKGSVERVGELMKQFGGTRVLIHYGGQSAVRSGVLDRVKKTAASLLCRMIHGIITRRNRASKMR